MKPGLIIRIATIAACIVAFVFLLVWSPDRAVAVGTLLVAALAIWGEWLRSLIAGPKLVVDVTTPQGQRGLSAPGASAPYHYVAAVRNKRPWALAKAVRVLCTDVHTKTNTGHWKREGFVSPRQLEWAHGDDPKRDIVGEELFFLGRVPPDESVFSLTHYAFEPTYECTEITDFAKGKDLRLSLIVAADNYAPKSPYLLEICWERERPSKDHPPVLVRPCAEKPRGPE